MDDNYSNELAALERLAQAEEADRQRVTAAGRGSEPSTGELIEMIDAGLAIGYDVCNDYDLTATLPQFGIGFGALNQLRDHFEALERENARLLAVADAAQDYINKRYSRGTVRANSLAVLLEALKALE